MQVRLGAQGITRRFGAVVANDRVDLTVRPGTVHAVVGENGAGKTTLLRVLFGLERPDAGAVVVDDRQVRLAGPRDALARGIGMVHQELALVPQLTLLENLVLGAEPTRGPLVDWSRARRRAAELAEASGVQLDWDLPAAHATIGARQRLEILRLLYRGADTLILDEPTAVLAPSQVDELLRLLAGLRDEGRTIVFVSHKLDEVLRLGEDVTVLRGGRSVATLPCAATDQRRLAELMVGEAPPPLPVPPASEPGPVVLAVERLAAGDDQGVPRLDGATLAVRRGETVGVAAVAGNGQDELVECVVGLRRPTGGTVSLDGEDVTAAPIDRRRARGLAYISADRRGEGLAVAASLADNLVAGFHRAPPLVRHGLLPRSRVRAFARALLDRFAVRHRDPDQPAADLSGGNQQLVVVARELTHEPTLLVAAQPTRGVDVKGIAFVHGQLAALRARGCGVLLVSEELDELLTCSDRVVVLYRGRVAGEVPGRPEARGELGRLMTGARTAAGSEVVA